MTTLQKRLEEQSALMPLLVEAVTKADKASKAIDEAFKAFSHVHEKARGLKGVIGSNGNDELKVDEPWDVDVE